MKGKGNSPIGLIKDKQMENFLSNLLIQFERKKTLSYSEFMKENEAALKDEIQKYLDKRNADIIEHDYLFNCLSIIPRYYLFNGRVGESQKFWEDLLRIVIEWERYRNSRIHKGSIFFFWSESALLQGQFDKGFFLIHSAFEEDCLTNGIKTPNTPAFKTVALNYSDNRNLLYRLVKDWGDFLDEFLTEYRNITQRKLVLDSVRAKFLEKPPSANTLFSFTYVLARFFDYDHMPRIIIQGSFASLFDLNALFDLILVIDKVIYSSISNPGKNDWKFIELLKILLQRSGLSTDQKENERNLKTVNISQNIDFANTIINLLNLTFTHEDGEIPSRLECDIYIVYCLRNYSAHNIDSFPIINEKFYEIRQSVFNVLFLSIECS